MGSKMDLGCILAHPGRFREAGFFCRGLGQRPRDVQCSWMERGVFAVGTKSSWVVKALDSPDRKPWTTPLLECIA